MGPPDRATVRAGWSSVVVSGSMLWSISRWHGAGFPWGWQSDFLRRPGILARANSAKGFRRELVAQDPADEPDSAILERVINSMRVTTTNQRRRDKRIFSKR